MSAESLLARALLEALSDEATAREAARLLGPFLAGEREWNTPWMDAHEAADYLRCKGWDGRISVGRVRKLTSTGDLPHEHDGSRVLYHRDALDAFIRRGGAISP